MSYRVTFNTLAKMGDNKVGNIVQDYNKVIYTDQLISQIPSLINADLEAKEKVCVILKIEHVEGKCLN